MGWGESVTRIRRTATGAVDRYNNAVFTTAETTVTGAAFAPGKTDEPVEVGRDPVVSSPTLYWRTVVDARADDRWRVRGVVYDTDGDPSVWSDPFGTPVGGTVVKLKSVTEAG